MERIEILFKELKIDLKPELRRMKISSLIGFTMLVCYLILGVFIYSSDTNEVVSLKAIWTQIYVCGIVSYFLIVVVIHKMGFEACHKFLMEM